VGSFNSYWQFGVGLLFASTPSLRESQHNGQTQSIYLYCKIRNIKVELNTWTIADGANTLQGGSCGAGMN